MTSSRRPPSGIAFSLVLVVVLALVPPPSATFSLVRDTDASAGNPLQAGSFDDTLSEVGPATEDSTTDERGQNHVRDTWEDHTHANGSTAPVNNTVEIANPNTAFALADVEVTVAYAENDSTGADDDARATAASLNVTEFRYDGTSYLENVSDANGNGRTDVDDLSRTTTTLDGLPANESAALTLVVSGNATAGVGGGDGIDFTLSFTATVAPSWTDTDRSTNNTIQYDSS